MSEHGHGWIVFMIIIIVISLFLHTLVGAPAIRDRIEAIEQALETPVAEEQP